MTIPERAAALKSLPPFPPVASKAICMLTDDSVSFREIAETLSMDAGLSAEIIRLANSPLFSTRYGINSVLHALAVVGTRRLTGLILTVSMSKFIKRIGKSDIMRRSWRHNLACAVAAKEFAKSFGRDTNEAYDAGLFHDVGRLAFLTIDPVFYDTFTGDQVDLRESELTHFGIDHCEAGAWVIEEWKLPQHFLEVARYHHAPKAESELTMLVNASCVIANQLGFSVLPTDNTPGEFDCNDELCSSITDFIASLESRYGI